MKQCIKTIIKILFGTKENIAFKFSLSSLATSIVFFILSVLYKDNSAVLNTLVFLCELFLAIWIVTAKGGNVLHFVYELLRLMGFLIAFIFVFSFFINISKHTGILLWIYTSFAGFIILLCSFYLVSKLSDIFDFFKKIFNLLKSKLYNTSDPPTSKAKAFIENITALLASIIALSVAVQTIANTIINLFHSLK